MFNKHIDFTALFLCQVEHLDIPEAAELRKLKLLKEELGELAAQGECLL